MKDSLDILCTEPQYVAHDSLNILCPDVICHYGILGMKWGIRRYQNKDGSLTKAGQKRYLKKWDKEFKKGKNFGKFRQKAMADMTTLEEAKHLYKSAYSGDPNANYNLEKAKIAERITGRKWDMNDPVQERIWEDLDSPFLEKKISKEDYNKFMDETEIEYRTNKTPEGYKLTDYSKDPNNFIEYVKESPSNKKHDYKLYFIPSMHDDRPGKRHEDFEKNSDSILKQCKDATYKEIKSRIEDYDVSKEDFSKYFDTPNVRIESGNDIAQITSFDSFSEHFPVIEYDLKNKKVLRVSLDG